MKKPGNITREQQMRKPGILSQAEAKWNPLYVKMGGIFLSVGAAALLVFWIDNTQPFPSDESGFSIVGRNSQGEGEREEKLKVQVGGTEETMNVTVEEQEYTQEQLEKTFQSAGEKLEVLVLGENESLDEVRSNLKLISAIPDTGISVSWELENHDVMNQQGELKTENLPDEGILVKLTAVMSYKEEMASAISL